MDACVKQFIPSSLRWAEVNLKAIPLAKVSSMNSILCKSLNIEDDSQGLALFLLCQTS
jgi:hypothetical protein